MTEKWRELAEGAIAAMGEDKMIQAGLKKLYVDLANNVETETGNAGAKKELARATRALQTGAVHLTHINQHRRAKQLIALSLTLCDYQDKLGD